MSPDKTLPPHPPKQRAGRGSASPPPPLTIPADALVRAEARWRALVLATGQITWVLDAQGRSLDSLSWCAYTGQTPEEAAQHWLDAIHPADQALVSQAWAHAFASQEPYRIEYRIRRADGVYRMFETRGIPILDAVGTFIEWVGACTDVTERSQAQMDLQAFQEHHRLLIETTAFGIVFQDAQTGILAMNPAAEREQLRGETVQRISQFAGLFETISDGVAVYDCEGRFVAMNQALLDLYGFDRDTDMVEKSLAERAQILQVRDPRGQPLAPGAWGLGRMLRGEVISSANAVEIIVTRADGRDVQVSITGAPIRNAQGEITGAVTVARDITERARLDQMKDDFINVASHELRAPLTPVILACRFIQRALNRPEQAAKLDRYAGEIVIQAKRLSRLVDDMLDMTRITNNHFAIQRAPCDLAKTILDAVEEQRAVWHRAIFEEGLTHPFMTMADAERIWQVMTNLLTNAMKYAPASEPIIVRAEIVPAASAQLLRITVQDRGPGIPIAAQTRIFERFYRLPDSDQPLQAPNGLGLGLFITRAIVEAHGGHITIESPSGGGSAFVVELPLSPPP